MSISSIYVQGRMSQERACPRNCARHAYVLIPCDVRADLQLSLIVTPNPEFPQPRIHKECACMLRRGDDYNNEVCRRLSKGRQGMERCAALCSDGCIHWGTICYCLLYPKMGRPRKPTKRQRTNLFDQTSAIAPQPATTQHNQKQPRVSAQCVLTKCIC